MFCSGIIQSNGVHMKKNLFRTALAALSLSLPFAVSAADLSISGAGASFPAPVYRV